LSAIFAIACGVAALLTTELLPVSLLTPIADSLGITEGVAEQTVSVTAFAAIFSSLLVTTVTRGFDRRLVVLGYSVLLVASSLLAVFGPSLTGVMAGRVLLGRFWSMAASLAMRLVPEKDVAKALSIVFGGSRWPW
jgi:DHA1 family purine ribonucleoside efflux pump-like MFS transporter